MDVQKVKTVTFVQEGGEASGVEKCLGSVYGFLFQIFTVDTHYDTFNGTFCMVLPLINKN